MRQASQCLGRVIRSKKDYGVMVFADQRYARSDKRSKIPDWTPDGGESEPETPRIRNFLEPGHVFMATDLAVEAAGNFLLQMSQPYAPRSHVLSFGSLKKHGKTGGKHGTASKKHRKSIENHGKSLEDQGSTWDVVRVAVI